MTALRGGERNELKTNRSNDSFQTNEIFTDVRRYQVSKGAPGIKLNYAA